MTETHAEQSTTDWTALHLDALNLFGALVDEIDDWTSATPDSGWTIADLVRHVISEVQQEPTLLAGRTAGEALSRVDIDGDALAADWAATASKATDAWTRAELGSPVHLSYDTVTAEHYLHEMVAEITIHAWDLARAVGAQERLPEQLVEAAWTVFEPQQATLQASGLYASIVPVAEDAPLQTRLLALTGRDDRIPAL